MPAFTAQDIVDRASAQADMHDNFVTPTTWLAWLNYEVQALDTLLARSGYIIRSTNTETIATVAGGSAVGFPVVGEVKAIIGVYEFNGSTYRPLRLRPRVDTPIGTLTGTPESYSAWYNGDQTRITLYPQPSGSDTYVVVYLPVLARLTALTEDIMTNGTVPLGFEEWLVLRLARRALVKEESDTRQVEQLLQETEREIREICWARSLADAPSVRNTDAQYMGAYPAFGAPEAWAWL